MHYGGTVALKISHHVVLFAVNFPVDIVECLPPESPPARAADEAGGVVQRAHRLTRLPTPTHLLAARHAVSYKEKETKMRNSEANDLFFSVQIFDRPNQS